MVFCFSSLSLFFSGLVARVVVVISHHGPTWTDNNDDDDGEEIQAKEKKNEERKDVVRVEKKKQRRRQRGNGDTESDGNALRSRSPSHSSPAAVLFLCEIPCSKLFLCVCGVWVLGGEKAYLQFIIIVRRSWG
jgi:hypothetical protein